MNTNGRPWYFWPLIAFVGGLLIGWLVIGWGLWPVTWTNATVQDLTPALRIQYVSMVAESYAQTGNLELARQRLAGWPQEDLVKVLNDAQTVLVARDSAESSRVQQLAVALGATAARGADGGQGEPAVQGTAATAGGAAAAAQPAAPSRLRQICTAGIFIVLALAALAGLIYLFRRWRSAQMNQPGDVDESDFAVPPFRSAVDAAEQEKSRWPVQEPFERDARVSGASPITQPPARPERPADDNGVESRVTTVRPASPLRPVGPPPSTPRIEPAEDSTPAQPTPAPSARTSENLQPLGENTAVYQMGEADYDEAFDINDPVDGYMGQCGLQLIEPFGRERDQAVALQVWLWDSSDPDTQTLVLMSEGAYRDTALRSQYAGEHQAIAVRPGTEFELNSHDLLLRGRVEKVSYAEAEPVRGVFADLQVKLNVYRRS